MVHGMPATRNSKLKLKYVKNGVSFNKFNNVYRICIQKKFFLSNIKENNKIVYFGYGTVRGERERECVQLPVEEQMQHMP